MDKVVALELSSVGFDSSHSSVTYKLCHLGQIILDVSEPSDLFLIYRNKLLASQDSCED